MRISIRGASSAVPEPRLSVPSQAGSIRLTVLGVVLRSACNLARICPCYYCLHPSQPCSVHSAGRLSCLQSFTSESDDSVSMANRPRQKSRIFGFMSDVQRRNDLSAQGCVCFPLGAAQESGKLYGRTRAHDLWPREPCCLYHKQGCDRSCALGDRGLAPRQNFSFGQA